MDRFLPTLVTAGIKVSIRYRFSVSTSVFRQNSEMFRLCAWKSQWSPKLCVIKLTSNCNCRIYVVTFHYCSMYFIVPFCCFCSFITAHQRNCGKVMFSPVSVILFTAGSNVTISHDTLDLTVQGHPSAPTPHPRHGPHCHRDSKLMTFSDQDWNPIQFFLLDDPSLDPPGVDIWWLRSVRG